MDEQALPPFFFEIFHRSLHRQGPGNEESTIKALQLLGLLDTASTPPRPGANPLHVLDVGCGTGAQTLVLAKNLDAGIVALDFCEPFLDELRLRAEAAGLASAIETRLGSMRDLPSWPERFDLVWAEGSLFVMGFADALKACREVLERGGLLAASELTWLLPDAPEECREFLGMEYPPMTDVAGNLAHIQAAGYELVDHFALPEDAWWTYYRPLEARLAELRPLHAGNADNMALIDMVQTEIDMYRRYSPYYGYVFYLVRRP